MLISEKIAEMIESMLDSSGGSLELQRNKLAENLGCVPSQINYVITSRFSADRGYIVESRRGGGGCIKITRVSFDKSTYLMHMLGAIGQRVDMATARAFIGGLFEHGLINERESAIIASMLTNNAFGVSDNIKADYLRARLLKNLVLTLNNI